LRSCQFAIILIVLQRVAVSYSALQCSAVTHGVAVYCNVFQWAAICCSVIWRQRALDARGGGGLDQSPPPPTRRAPTGSDQRHEECVSQQGRDIIYAYIYIYIYIYIYMKCDNLIKLPSRTFREDISMHNTPLPKCWAATWTVLK